MWPVYNLYNIKEFYKHFAFIQSHLLSFMFNLCYMSEKFWSKYVWTIPVVLMDMKILI